MKKLIHGAAIVSIVFSGLLNRGHAQWAWEKELSGDQSGNPDIIALWKFEKDGPAEDSSGNQHTLLLRGSDTHFVQTGKFGGGLEIREENDPGDKASGAVLENVPELTPEGAFTMEMWIRPSEQLSTKDRAYLVDNKYLVGDTAPTANRGFKIFLRRSGEPDKHRYYVSVNLGLADGTAGMAAGPLELLPDEWAHIAFTYDGEKIGRVYRDGKLVGEKEFEHSGPLVPASREFVIGDRVGSNYYRFLGTISQVRLLNKAVDFSGLMTKGLHFLKPLDFERSNYFRLEENQTTGVVIHNRSGIDVKGLRVRVRSAEHPERIVEVPPVADGKSVKVQVPVDTALKAGEYKMEAVLLDADGKESGEPVELTYSLYNRINPNRMPVVMWGESEEPEILRDIGFTHYCMITQSSFAAMGEYSEEALKSMNLALDGLVPLGMEVAIRTSPASSSGMSRPPLKNFQRVDSKGNLYKPRASVNGLFPEVQEVFRESAEWTVNQFSWSPVLTATLIDTEVRDSTRPSYHDIDKEAYRKFSGQEIPANMENRSRGMERKEIPGFPANDVVPDDHPILTYLRWFWTVGDGWNNLHSIMNDVLQEGFSDKFWTWFDPAVRTPSIFGSGGNVDYLSQWTYTYPDPVKMALATDELFAMASGKPGQEVMKMTQIIWYRRLTAPAPAEGAVESPEVLAQWEKDEPEAKFITISPDHLKEALWLKLSYSVQGIMYHGIGSLLPGHTTSYRYTHPETVKELKKMLHEVVEPLGPALMEVPEIPADVAMLESFTSQMFVKGIGSYGWGNGWSSDSYLVLRYAGLQPAIIYEDHVQKGELEKFKVLVMPNCPVLTESVVKAVRDFQRAGGIVVADEWLCPEIQPDILMPEVTREAPDVTKKKMLERGAALIAELKGYYEPALTVTNQEIIGRQRQAGDGQYLVFANDARKYGDYVGRHRLVMEDGVPAEGEVRVRGGHAHVYDLVNRKQVASTQKNGWTNFPVSYEGGGGGIYLLLDESVKDLKIESAGSVKQGEGLDLEIAVRSASEEVVDAVIPLKVTVTNAEGKETEGSGYYGAVGGKLKLHLDIATNDAPGDWKVEVEEGTQGIKGEYGFKVTFVQNP